VAWPAGVTLRTCSLGPDFGLASGADYGCDIVVSVSRPMMTWGATGSGGIGDQGSLSFTPGMEVTFQLPVTDQAGWYIGGLPVDMSDGRQSHVYTLTIKPWIYNSLGRKTFSNATLTLSNLAVPTGPDTLDLDKSVATSGAQGGTVTIPDLVGQLQATVETSATDAAASASAAAASAQTAHDISNIDTSDDVVSTLVADPQTGPKTTAALNAAIAAQTTVAGPRRLLVSTDWYTDCDDVGAMRVLRKAEQAGLVDVMAVVVDTGALSGATSLDAFWRAEGRQVQIGQIPGADTDLNAGGPYQAGLLALPHYGASAGSFPNSTTVLRTALASSPDNSVDVLGIGYENALSDLLNSPADAISTLTGAQLIAAKVRHTWIMGGAYPSGVENNFDRSTSTKAAANNLVTNWPAPTGWTTAEEPCITFLGFEVGSPVVSGGNQVPTPTSDPMYAAYVAHGSATGRSSWDPMTALLAAIGDPAAAGYTTVRGTNVHTLASGANTFTASATGPHEYVVKTQSDAWYVAQLNELFIPGRIPTWLNPTGRKFTDLRPGATMPLVTGTTDLGLPVLALRASDLSLTDGASVASVNAVGSTTSAFTAQSGNQPTYAAAKAAIEAGSSVSKKAISFNGSQWLESVATFDRGQSQWTIYAKVCWDTLPTTNQGVVGRDASTGIRDVHLAGISGGLAQAVGWNSGTAVVDTAPGLVAGHWHTVILRKNDSGVEALVDGLSDGAVTAAAIPTAGALPFHVGVSYLTGSTGAYSAHEGMVGWVAEMRVYDTKHTDAQVTTYMAQLA
jgi:hypothetical protein